MFAGVGERTREGNDLYSRAGDRKDATGKAISEGSRRAGLRSDERASGRPCARRAVGPAPWRNISATRKGKDVLFFVDNIFRFTQAGAEVSALLGRIPSAVGYQPTLADRHGQLQERITSTNKGSITSVQAVYVPADDLTDPAPATSFAHLDATTVLNRAISRAGHLPGGRSARLDQPDAGPAASSARIIMNVARAVQEILQKYKACRTSSPSWAWTSCRKRTS